MSANALSEEVGVHQGTLSRWLRLAHASRLTTTSDKKEGSKKGARSVEEKLRILSEAAGLSDEDLGAFLRKEGVYEAELGEWREAIRDALGEGLARGRSKTDAKRIKELERELRRKEKALAEAAALLILKKRVQEIWGGEDDVTDEETEK
jgi:transposase-like protein